jgi:hypothetical protein
LSKKVSFFKASTLKATNATESQVAAHCSLIETSQVKAQLNFLKKQVAKFRKIHKKEKAHIFEQVRFFYSNIRNVLDIMGVRIREEGKKNLYLVNDVTRLNRDIEHLKKVNEEFSVKLRDSRALSKMTSLRATIDPQNFDSIPHNTQRTQNTQFLMNANLAPQEVTQRTERSTISHTRGNNRHANTQPKSSRPDT